MKEQAVTIVLTREQTRDLFAAAVRDSEIEGHFPRIADAASYIGVTVDEYEKAPRVYWHRVVARFKYERADAMLAAREEAPK